MYERFRRWRDDGTWKAIVQVLQGGGRRPRPDRLVAVLRGHDRRPRHPLGGRGEKGGPVAVPDGHALGLGRGGTGTKISLVTNANGLPLGVALTRANVNESKGLDAALDDVTVPQRRGRPRKRPRAIAGDKGYDHPSIRRKLRRRGPRVVIAKRRPDPRHRPKRGRPFGFDPDQYRRCNAVERCVGWLKENRRLATRYEKLAVSYRAVVHVAMIRLYLRRLTDGLSDRT